MFMFGCVQARLNHDSTVLFGTSYYSLNDMLLLYLRSGIERVGTYMYIIHVKL